MVLLPEVGSGMGSLGMIDALGRGPVALVFFLELHKAATAGVDARVGVPLIGIGMVVGQALDHAPHRARPHSALQRRVGSRHVRGVGLPGHLVFRGTTSVITVHHRGKDDSSPDEDERLGQPREEPPHGEVGEVVCSKSPIKLPTPKGSGGPVSCADPMRGEEAGPGSYDWLGF